MTLPIKRFNVSTNSFIDCLLLSKNVDGGSGGHRHRVDRLLKVLHALLMVFEVTLVLFLFTLFTLVVIDDALNDRDRSMQIVGMRLNLQVLHLQKYQFLLLNN